MEAESGLSGLESSRYEVQSLFVLGDTHPILLTDCAQGSLLGGLKKHIGGGMHQLLSKGHM